MKKLSIQWQIITFIYVEELDVTSEVRQTVFVVDNYNEEPTDLLLSTS